LPLALELAAPWLKVLTPEELLRRLTADTLLATIGPRDLPERQQTMNATIGWSYQLLGPNEQRAFRRLGALPDRFPIEAAAAVLAGREDFSAKTDEALGTTAALIDKSLLLRAETSVASRPLYQMLETVRAYAALELTASGERDDALEGLARYCAGEASRAAEALVGPAQAEWLNRVRDDLENYRRTLTWLIERGRSAEAGDIAWGLALFWVIRGRAAEGLRWYEQTLNLPSLPAGTELRALLGAVVMWYVQGELERARAGLTRALALAHSSGNTFMAVQAENMFGYIEHALGNLAEARNRFTRSVEGFQALGISRGTGQPLTGMAWVALGTGDVGEAERLLDEAAFVLRDAGPWFQSPLLCIRAILAVRRGNADEAIGLVRKSLTHIRELHDKLAFVYVLAPLAAAASLKGDHVWAARILGARDAVIERTGTAVVNKGLHDVREQAEREARARLGPSRWERAYAAGRVTSADALMKDIDSVLQSRAGT
jgi:non-specific serine/threonine protein kinase